MSKIASRRKHQRYGCSIPARLEFDQNVLEVLVMNFCHQGMLINCSPKIVESINLNIKNLEHPKANLIIHLSGHSFELVVELRRAYDTFFGVFVNEGLSPLLFETLTLSSAETSAHNPGRAQIRSQQRSDVQASRQRLMAHDVIAAHRIHLTPVLKRYFSLLPDKLMSYAEKTAQAQHVQKLFSLSASFKQQAQEFQFSFQQELQEQILTSLTGTHLQQNHAQNLSELSLVETEVFDQWVAIKATAQRIENAIHLELSSVLDRLKPHYLKPDEMPMLPRGLAFVLQQKLMDIGFDQTSQRAALELFSSHVPDGFKLFLNECNKILEKHGYILKTEKKRPTQSSHDDDLQEPVPGLIPSAAGIDYKSSLASANESLNKVRALLRGLHSESVSDEKLNSNKSQVNIEQLGQSLAAVTQTLVDTYDGKPVWSQEQVIKMLMVFFGSEITQGLAEKISQYQPQYHSALKAIKRNAQKDNAKISVSELNALELIDAFFDDMIANDFLIQDIRFILNQFRCLAAAEYIKLGHDAYQKSPIKHMIFRLQTIAHEPLVWIGRHKKSVLECLDTIYQQRFDDQGLITAIKQMNLQLLNIEKQLTDIRQKNKTRLIQAANTKIKTQQKRAEVTAFLKRFFNRQGMIPRWLEHLMRMGWSEYLSLLKIRDAHQEYDIATTRTRTLFEVIDIVSQVSSGLTEELKTQLLETLQYIKNGLDELHTTTEALEHWQEQMSDIINGHSNALLQQVPPGLWYQATDKHSVHTDHYLYKKMELLETGQWLHCPHLERDKNYIQIAWIAPDRSLCLLVNHSFISVGEFEQRDILDLLSLATTRIVNENLLPFMPKGIENQFFRIYDKIRNGLLRDQLTGFMVTADLENLLNNAINQDHRHLLVALRIQELRHIESVYGAEALNQCVTQIAMQLHQQADIWNQNHPAFNIDQFTRTQDNLFFFTVSHDAQHKPDRILTQQLQMQLHQFTSQVSEKLSRISIHQHDVRLSLCFSCIETDQKEVSAHYYLSAVAQAIELQKPSAQLFESMYQAHIKDLEQEHKRQEQLSWIHQVTLETIQQKIKIQNNIIRTLEGDTKAIHLIPAGDQELLHLVFQSGRGWILDQLLIQTATQKLQTKSDIDTVYITLKTNFIEHNQFFDIIYAQMASLPKAKKLHFCFDNEHLPELESLADFCREIKSYGCEVSLFNWGQDSRSFEILQYNFFSQLALSETLLDIKSPEKKALLNALVALARDLKINLILPQTQKVGRHDFETLIGLVEPTYIEVKGAIG